jgi:hypothetical protein
VNFEHPCIAEPEAFVDKANAILSVFLVRSNLDCDPWRTQVCSHAVNDYYCLVSLFKSAKFRAGVTSVL